MGAEPTRDTSNAPDGFEVLPIVAKLLSKLSKSYISQVKHGKRPPSQKLIQAIEHLYGKKRKRNGFSIDKAHCVRDKAIVSLFTESGLRLSELLHIKTRDIDWKSHTIKVLGKGNKEGLD